MGCPRGGGSAEGEPAPLGEDTCGLPLQEVEWTESVVPAMVADGTRVEANETFCNTIWSTMQRNGQLHGDRMGTIGARFEGGVCECPQRTIVRGRTRPELPPRSMPEDTILGIVQRGAFELGISRLLSPMRTVEKARRIQLLVREADGSFVKAVTKLKPRFGREPVRWALGEVIWDICNLRVAWSWESMKVLGMAVISANNLLRVGSH